MSSHVQQQCLPGALQVHGCKSKPRRWHCATHRSHPSSRHNCQCRAVAQGDDDAADLASAFNKELLSRQTQQQAAQEQDVAREFDGQQLLKVLQSKYGRSYDVSLVQRKYLGKQLIALNIMWRYREQASFAVRQAVHFKAAAAQCRLDEPEWHRPACLLLQLSEEEYMERLDGVAGALRAWGKVQDVTSLIASSKSRPRVGKAISIPIELPEDVLREWFLIH